MLRKKIYSREAIELWLVSQISKIAQREENQINKDCPLAEYGLDSLNAVGLSGDIEDKLGIEVEPTIAWDYPTITQMSEHLYTTLSTQSCPQVSNQI
jgi:acyl carrier protein